MKFISIYVASVTIKMVSRCFETQGPDAQQAKQLQEKNSILTGRNLEFPYFTGKHSYSVPFGFDPESKICVVSQLLGLFNYRSLAFIVFASGGEIMWHCLRSLQVKAVVQLVVLVAVQLNVLLPAFYLLICI